ncbi:hypothetical protein [Pseudomonas brassicacearum]|uniref:Uncharacterized protein n=1 Tax=Pseudomonas brassicacearum TaxID=930166 RepID=A0AAJ3G0R5_9PSED|nr:hypothetical protein [Pseudomonas brassicacearum]NUT84251.1 hypothetical protein [Pseudomonas brassicacearum]
MELRADLMPPVLDELLVARLKILAEEIDCGHPEKSLAHLAAFNKEAMTEFEFIDFQGIYGGQSHDAWVRKILAKPYERCLGDVTKQELIELARRVMESDGPDSSIEFWLGMLEINIPNDRVSNLIFWPGEYFNNVSYSEELTPEQVIEVALKDGNAPQ